MDIAQTTQETLGLMKDSLSKAVTLATGLSAYDLQAPAKNLYPVITPLRNALPRVARATASCACCSRGPTRPSSPAAPMDWSRLRRRKLITVSLHYYTIKPLGLATIL